MESFGKYTTGFAVGVAAILFLRRPERYLLTSEVRQKSYYRGNRSANLQSNLKYYIFALVGREAPLVAPRCPLAHFLCWQGSKSQNVVLSVPAKNGLSPTPRREGFASSYLIAFDSIKMIKFALIYRSC